MFTFLKLSQKYFISHSVKFFSTKSLSEHCGWLLKVSLCLERQPIEYTENETDKIFREFRELWSLQTKNSLKIPSLTTIERKITHKLPRTKEKQTKSITKDSTDQTSEHVQVEDLESLLMEEVDLSLIPRRSRRVLEKEKSEKIFKVRSDDDLHNINRYPKNWLFFLVKYNDFEWSLPETELYYGDSIRETLVRLCEEQITPSYSPYFIGSCPFTHQLLPFPSQKNTTSNNKILDEESPIDGEKVFYYRARHIPSSEFDDTLVKNVKDFAWCTFDELTCKLDKIKYQKIINSLPIFNFIQ